MANRGDLDQSEIDGVSHGDGELLFQTLEEIVDIVQQKDHS